MSARRITAQLEARVRAAELATNSTAGLAAFAALVQLGSLADREVPIIGCELTRQGQRVRVEREPGEPLASLFARAVPSGGWRARAVPVFGPMEGPLRHDAPA